MLAAGLLAPAISPGLALQEKVADDSPRRTVSVSGTGQISVQADIPAEDIQTQVVRLYPRYEEQPGDKGQRELVGYTAANVVEVRLRDLDTVGGILDTAIQAGGNRIEGIRFEVSDPAAYLDQAREAVWRDARHKAEQLASLANANLGEVLTISESGLVPQSRGEQVLLPPEWEKEEVFEMYKSKSDLPSTLREYLPEDLQEIYLEAYQRSWKGYEEFRGGEAGQGAVAHRDAMMAVKRDHVYHEETGKWYRKGEEPEEEEEEQGFLETLQERVKDL